MRHRERGGASVLVIVALVFAGALMIGLARLGHAASNKARAETAADAAALAAAGALARGGDASAASGAAEATARSNGARLEHCSCGGVRPTVVVQVGDATARSGAEVRYECFADPAHC
ncbi:MAG: Rv3654c family TadE-like protein [Acidimicrobiia bacterium]